MGGAKEFTIVIPSRCIRNLRMSRRRLVVSAVRRASAGLERGVGRSLGRQLMVMGSSNRAIMRCCELSMENSTVRRRGAVATVVTDVYLCVTFVLVSTIKAILTVRSLDSSAGCGCHCRALGELKIGSGSLFGAVEGRLLVLFNIPIVCSVLTDFFVLMSIGGICGVCLRDRCDCLVCFMMNLTVFFFVCKVC